MNRKRIMLQSILERSSNAWGTDVGAAWELSPPAAPVFGQEQDLCGFEGQLGNLRDRAIENILFLHRLAEYLGDLSGGEECHEVPEWALARNTCHSYYSQLRGPNEVNVWPESLCMSVGVVQRRSWPLSHVPATAKKNQDGHKGIIFLAH